MALWLCIIAIVISILVGWKYKLNTGIIAMGFAFVIGICVMGMKASDVINFWPTTIVFYLLSISLFFNYATENGTMNVLGQKLLHAMGGNAKLVPFAIAAVSAIVGGLGAGASTPAIGWTLRVRYGSNRWRKPGSDRNRDHLRQPDRFQQPVQRLRRKYFQEPDHRKQYR